MPSIATNSVNNRTVLRRTRQGFTLAESLLAAALGLALLTFVSSSVSFFSRHTSQGTAEALQIRELTVLFQRLRRVLTRIIHDMH